MKNSKKTENEEDLRNLAPTLFGIRKENPFSVPDQYFDSLSSVISDRCLTESQKPTLIEKVFVIRETMILIRHLRNQKVSVTLAAFLLLAFFGIKQVLITPDHSSPVIAGQHSEVSCVSLMDYVDEETLTEALSENNPTEIISPATDKTSNDKKAMEEYLLNNHIDLTLISSEL